MSRTPNRPKDDPERNLPGMPPAEERQRPAGPPADTAKRKSAWSRGDGGMEGPAGWSSEFGRSGFASTGTRLNDGPAPKNPLESSPPAAEDHPERPRAPKPEHRPVQGEPTDPWDLPYGDATWGGQAAQATPEESKAVDRAARKTGPRGRR